MQAMVLSIIGKDKPGLVDDVAQAVSNAEGNWLKSSFCHLAGHFAGFVEIMLPRENHNDLLAACHALANLQITLVPAHEVDTSNLSQIKLKVTGNDRKGIVKDVTSALKTFNINILELTTVCESAPNWGSLLFTAKIKVEAPADFEVDKLSEAIEAIADDLIVDIKKVKS